MGVSWLKTGGESAELAKKQAVEAAIAKEEQGKMFRFYIKEGEDAQITFVDGDLSPEGFLLPPRFYEHGYVLYNGSHNNNFVCPEKTNPGHGETCPLCEGGDKPSLVAMFTVIDHRTHVGKNNKEYKNMRRLLPAKPQSYELLNKIAIKRGGLAGCRFDVSRQGDKSAAIGSMFDFVDKKDPLELQALYQQEVFEKGKPTGKMETYFKPADYEHEITYRTGDQLRAMGFGKPLVSGGGIVMPSSMGGDTPDSPGETSYEDNL